MIEYTPQNLLLIAGIILLIAVAFVFCIKRELK